MVKKNKGGTVAIAIVIGLILFLTLYPLLVMVVSSLKSNVQIRDNLFWFSTPFYFENYSKAFGQIYQSILNSIIVTVGNVVLCYVISSMAAYAFARMKFRFKGVFFYSMMMMMMVPYFLILTPQFVVSKNLGLLNTYAVQILPASAAFAILSTFLLTTQMESLPQSLFEQGEIEGAGTMTLFLRIAIPLSKPTLAVVGITNIISSWNNYIWPLVAANDKAVRPVIIQITNITAASYQVQGTKFAAYVIACVPLLLVFSIFTKPFVEGLTAGAIKA